MNQFLIAALLIGFNGPALSQDMSRAENYREVIEEMPNGESRYSGACLTHEDYKNREFRVERVLTRYFEPREMTKAQVARRLSKYDRSALEILVKTFEIDELEEEAMSIPYIMVNYVDDLTVDKVTLARAPHLNLLRFRMGVGGGNGGYLVLQKTTRRGRNHYKKMSYTFDGDLMYCDKKVWKN